jgi:acyl-CoA reductase-like NAD-dependent aldehyde dehydrogenase
MPVASRSFQTINPATGEVLVWVNMPNPLDAAAPWGGVKASSWGREIGKEALDLYSEVKSVWMALG